MAPPLTARHWMLTIREQDFSPGPQPESVAYLCGQLEVGEGAGGYSHWQLYAVFTSPLRLSGVKRMFPTAHAEPTRSSAAEAYCSKEATRVAGTGFEWGRKPMRRQRYYLKLNTTNQ